MKTDYIGVIEDPRPEVEKNKDWKAKDLFGSSVVDWKERGEDGWMNPILIRNQDGSSQCMAYSGAKGLGINEMRENGKFVNLSPTFIYRLRSNDGEGMFMQNLLDILVNYGSPKDEWFPCDGLSEAQVNKAPTPLQAIFDEALKYKGKGYVQTKPYDIEGIAQAIDKVGWCVILIRANLKEWTTWPYVNPSVTSSDWNVNHAVIATQYGLVNGNKHILVEDSWGSSFGKNGQRWISEDFISKRMFGAGYVIDMENLPITPKFNFTKDLEKGMISEDVKSLQRVLILENCLTVAEANTGWGVFGPKTLNAVVKLQDKYKSQILTPYGLTKGTGYVGKSTRAFINAKYK